MLALRIRASMSAIGSVIIAASPRSLRDAGDLAGMRQLAEAQPSQLESLVHGPRAAASATPRVRPHPELRPAPRFLDQRFLRHNVPQPVLWTAGSPRKGNPLALSIARSSSSVFAVVTTVMSIPRNASTLS